MKITAARFTQHPNKPSRYDKTVQSEEVHPFLSPGEVYLFQNPRAGQPRQPEMRMKIGNQLTGLFFEFPESPGLACGHIKGSLDLVLCEVRQGSLDVIVFPMMKPYRLDILERFAVGEFQDILDNL